MTPTHFLAVRSQVDEARTVLTLTGDVDLVTAPYLREQILDSAHEDGTVVIDLRDVHFMDSPGLGTLIHCHRQLADRSTTMVVQAPRGHVRDLFEVVGLASRLTVLP